MVAPVNRFDRNEKTKRKWSPPRVKVPQVRWFNLPVWLAKTLVVDVRDYQHDPRPVTLRRLRHSVRPRFEAPVFVVGAPRSGTSVLAGTIGTMPSVSYHREPVLMKAVARHVGRGDWSREGATRLIRAVYGALLAIHLDGDLRLVEKTPQNAFLVPTLAEAFPDGRFVHIVRDGRDASVSYLEKPWVRQVFAWTHRRDPGGQPYGPFAPWWVEPERRDEYESTSDLHRAIWVWRRHVEAARSALADVDPSRWIEVRYEELVRDPAPVGEQILDVLSVADPAERARFHDALGQLRGASVGRWHDRFDDVDLAVIEREAGALLRDLGQEPSR